MGRRLFRSNDYRCFRIIIPLQYNQAKRLAKEWGKNHRSGHKDHLFMPMFTVSVKNRDFVTSDTTDLRTDRKQ